MVNGEPCKNLYFYVLHKIMVVGNNEVLKNSLLTCKLVSDNVGSFCVKLIKCAVENCTVSAIVMQ